MPDPVPTPPVSTGPYTELRVTTFKISAPIEISFTTKTDSSHVPPLPVHAPCGCHDDHDGPSAFDLSPFMGILSSLMRGQSAPASVNPEINPDAAPPVE